MRVTDQFLDGSSAAGPPQREGKISRAQVILVLRQNWREHARDSISETWWSLSNAGHFEDMLLRIGYASLAAEIESGLRGCTPNVSYPTRL